jgi:aminoglycoside phosphotransferase (APT) family kinase protein
MTHARSLGEQLASVLAGPDGHPARIADLRRLSGGSSRELWSFTADTDEGATRMVLRRDPPGAEQGQPMTVEAELLRAAHRAGVPVPRVYRAGDGSAGLDGPFLLMEHLDGETIPRRLLRDEQWARARAGMAAELGRALARIHSVPAAELPALSSGDRLAQLRAEHDAFDEPHPALEVALRWLAEHRPDPVTDRLVHGDFRNGNLMVGPDGLVAVLDWELAHLGDPVEDLGWLCVKAWRFGASAPVGGFGDREQLLDGYAEVAGWRPSAEQLRWWEVFGTANWAVICRRQAERHLGGAERSVEMAVLGRRFCENEHDLLLTLGLTGPRTVADPLDGADPSDPSVTPGLHDRPTVAELLDAAAGFLLSDVVSADELDRGTRFFARVAANAMTIARRELLVGPAQPAEHRARLAKLGCADDRELVAAIRSGSLDGRWDEVLDAVRELTVAKLTVANPGYLAQPGA